MIGGTGLNGTENRLLAKLSISASASTMQSSTADASTLPSLSQSNACL
jgi:hypothetical protein